jgi:hypothetical protein
MIEDQPGEARPIAAGLEIGGRFVCGRRVAGDIQQEVQRVAHRRIVIDDPDMAHGARVGARKGRGAQGRIPMWARSAKAGFQREGCDMGEASDFAPPAP